MMFPEEVWYNIKNYDMPLESFEEFLKQFEEKIRQETLQSLEKDLTSTSS